MYPTLGLELVITVPYRNPIRNMFFNASVDEGCILVAVTSARWVGELGALMAHPPYTIFFKDKITLRPHPKFLPNSFHLNQPIYLPLFFPKPRDQMGFSITHLGCQMSISVVDWQKQDLQKVTETFYSTSEQSKDSTIFKQRLSKWISGCIHQRYH